MMGIDTAIRTEIMFCCVGIKLVKLQNIMALDDIDTGQWNRRNDGSFSPAD
ncbi:MAG: hypothetical protein JWQ10_1279 [Herbaspirillum sp.]|nr:hypothetical protein [Herbaspirillum sp.]